MVSDLDSIGTSLLQHSEKAEFSAAGALDRLFPFIYQASQRMSSRAIAAWLAKEHNVQLGYTSIARALREKNRRLLEFGEEMVDVARILELPGQQPGQIPAVLCDEERFRRIAHKVEKMVPISTPTGGYRPAKELDAAKKLKERWFVLDASVRETVIEGLKNSSANSSK